MFDSHKAQIVSDDIRIRRYAEANMARLANSAAGRSSFEQESFGRTLLRIAVFIVTLSIVRL